MDEHTATEIAYKNGYEAGKRDAMKWIPVEERLPKDNYNVLVLHRNGYVVINAWLWTHWAFGYERNSITHWMPLPAPPKEGE